MKENPLRVIFRFLAHRIPIRAVGASLAMTLLSSCTTAVYDMRQIQQPIVLNDNPFLSPATPSSLNLAKVDTYSADVYQEQMAASSGSTTATFTGLANKAQLNAFNKIGGQPNRTICDISLDVDQLAVNGLFVLVDKTAIRATGDVAEFRKPIIVQAAVTVTVTNRGPILIQTPRE